VKYFLILFIISCTQVNTINLKKHQFDQHPNKIVWIQVANLDLEHITLSKFSLPTMENQTSFEDFLCMGKMWNFSLFELRPESHVSMLIQSTGKKNIKSTCDDLNEKAIWSYLNKLNYKIGVFENEPTELQSLTFYNSCKIEKQDPILKNVTMWKMAKAPLNNKDFFHVSDAKMTLENQVYYDKSCLTGECYTLFSENIINEFEKFSKNTKNFLFQIRDFSYAKATTLKNVSKIKLALNDLDKVIKYFQKKLERNEDMLLIVSGASPIGLDFPAGGTEWAQFEQNGANLNYKNGLLTSFALASGARAENFCGYYDQSQIFERIFSGQRKKRVRDYLKNPFN
jgi:hypothetical protein